MSTKRKSNKTAATFEDKLGAGGAEGVDYQLNLILIALFRAADIYEEQFEIFSELLVCEKFDDLVLRYKVAQQNERYRLVQVKHVLDETKTLNYDQLTVGDKFGIEKYFNAYKNITQDERFRDTIDDLILFHNLDKSNDLDPYLETVLTEDPIFGFSQKKRNGKIPRVYKLNSKFITDYKYSIMRKLAKTLISLCIKNSEIKARNEIMKNVHMRLSADVISIGEGRFRSNFILREELSSGTADFRDILEEELQTQDGDYQTISERNIWMQNVRIRLCPDFGKKGDISQQPWPIKLNEPGDNELFDRFCSQFTLWLCQPNEEELEELVRTKCDQYFDKSNREGTFDIINGKLRRWFKSVKSEPLDQKFLLQFKDHWDELIAENESHREIQLLLPHSIEFEKISYPFDLILFMNDKAKKLFQVTTSDNTKLCTLKLLNNINLFVAADYLFTSKATWKHLEEIMQIIIKSLFIHVLVWEITKKERNSGILAKLMSLIEGKPLKKLIIIINDDNKNIISNSRIESHLMKTVDGTPKFDELSLEIKNRLHNQMVKFQGHAIKFNEIYPKGIPGDNADTLVWGSLLERDVIIGRELIVSEEYNLKHYINRTLTQKSSTPNAVKLTVNDNQQNLLKHFAKVLLVSDTAGMGKTTISSHLVQEFKHQNPHLWVVRLVALDCTNELREFDSIQQKDDCSYDNCIMNKLLKLSSLIEKFVFQQYLQNECDKGQLILIFDGYDEINLECRRAIVAILQYLRAKCNVRLIGITTRGQFSQDLEVTFQQNVLTLEPFTRENKLDYLKRFWSSSEGPSNTDRLEDYARLLIATISRTISEEESQLTGIPLQLRMLGEIFADEARCFEKNAEIKIKDVAVFSSIGLYRLYERFIEKKENIYLAEKLCINDGAASRDELLEPILQTQSKYARTLIFAHKSTPTIEENELEKAISLGIIHKHQGGINFIHRTFAEFLVAENLLQEYYQKEGVPVTEIIRGGVIVRILSADEFSIVRQFINSQLNHKRLLEIFCQEKYRKVLRNAFVRVFDRIAVNSVAEGTSGLLNFTLEFYWWLNSQELEDNLFGSSNKSSKPGLFNSCFSITSTDSKTGSNIGLMEMAFEKPTALSVIFEFIIEKWANSPELLIRTLKFLIQTVIFTNDAGRKNRDRLIFSLIGFQNRLLHEELIDYGTFQCVVLKAGAKESEHNYWNTCSVDYLRRLRINHNSLLAKFLEGKPYLVLQMIQYGRIHDCKKFFEMIHGNQEMDSNYIFDNFVENVFNVLDYWYERPNIRLYFTMLQGHVKNFRETYRLERFEAYLEEFRERCKINIMSDEVFLEFLLSIRHSIRESYCMHQMKIHESLELIENSALWGSTMTLQMILATGDIELGAIDRFQSELHEDISLTTRRILAVMRGSYAGSEFIPLLSVRCANRLSILQTALVQDMPLKVNIFSSWITSVDIFSCLMEMKCHQPIENFDLFLRFVDQKLSHYRLKYFEINFDEIVHHASHSEELLRIFETVSMSDLMELILVQSRDGVLLVQAFTFIKDDAGKLLALIKQKILAYIEIEDIQKLFQNCNMETEVVPQAAIDYLTSIEEPEKRKRLQQIVSHINEIMFLLIIYDQHDEQDKSNEVTDKDSQKETIDDIVIEEGVAEMGAEEAASGVAIEEASEAYED